MSGLFRKLISPALLLLSLACSHPGSAQESRATVNGQVRDVSSSSVDTATVTARNLATAVATSVKASEGGNYTIPFLVPGNYTITAEAQGFKTITQNVVLHVGDKLTVDLTLPVGEISETVTVTAAAPLLDETSAVRGGLVDNVRVTELPLNGRNPFQLANLIPGVVFAGNPSFTRPFDNGDNANFSINGGLRQTNAFLIDGAPDDALSDTAGDRSHANQNVAYIPTVDATQEFKIVTNFYDAQYGRTGGGVFNVTTKSGTNLYHGSVYDFIRRYQLDANSISQKAAGKPRYAVDAAGKNVGGHTLDQYGFALTGPLSIPGLYNGKDRTFFLFGFENYHESSPSPALTTTINSFERNGDFSAAGEPTIYDPYTTRLDASGKCCIRDPFPGNKIPLSRLQTSAGYKIAQAFPLPNFSPTGGDPLASIATANNFSTGANLSEDHFRNWIGRVDQNFGQRERVYVRYAHNRRSQVDNGATNFAGPLLDAQDPLGRTNDNAVVDSITQLSPRWTLDLRAAVARYNETVARSRVSGFDDTQLGFSSAFSSSRFVPVPPRISLGGNYTDVGTRNPRFGISTITSFLPSVEAVLGRHSIHIGADLRDIRYATGGGSFVFGGGQFSFNSIFTQANPTAAVSATSGSNVASLLLGAPSAGILSFTPSLLYRWHYFAGYVQDDWKLSQRLTLNLGLRYDVEGSPTESQNRQNRGFAFNAPSPLAGPAKTASSAVCPACSNLNGGLLFAGAGGNAREAFNTSYTHVQPRFGAVFRAYKDTIFRGGYGLFYLPEAAFGAAQGFAQDTAFVSSNIAGGTTPDNFRPNGNNAAAPPLNNPFPTVLKPTGNSLGLSTFEGQSIIFNNVDRKIPHVHQYSFGMQQQFPGNIKLDASYVGSRTMDINTNDNQAGGARNLNVLSNAQIAQARQTAASLPSPLTAAQYVGQSVPNPFAGLLPGTNLNGGTVSRQQLLLPYPQFLNVNFGQESVGKIWYDSAQVSVEKRYSHGLTLSGAYTWSKTLEAVSFLNSQDAAPFKNLSASDRPQRLVISGVYELPFGRGKMFAGQSNRAVELLIGGWQLNYIELIQSGQPTDLNGSAYLLQDPRLGVNKSFNTYFNNCVQQAVGNSSSQPNATNNGFVPCSNPAWKLTNGANLDLRSTPFRSGSIRNPWAPSADLSLSKRFNVTERYNGQFRFETFNVTNTAIRNNANTNPNSNQFGFVSISQSNIPRQVQLGFKLNF